MIYYVDFDTKKVSVLLIPFANIEKPSLNIILLASWEVLQERLFLRSGYKDKMESRPEWFR